MKEKQTSSAWWSGFWDGVGTAIGGSLVIVVIYLAVSGICSAIDTYFHHIVRAEVQGIEVHPRAQLIVNCYNLTEVKGKTTELSGTKCDVPENTIFRNTATGSDHVSYWDDGSHIAYKVQP